jgi:flagellar basal-body rod protein FlgG
MNRGFYSAAAGMLTGQKTINYLSNNIANVNTSGYKSQSTVESSFDEYLLSRISATKSHSKANIGTGSYMTIVDEKMNDFSQGNIELTDRSVDMAIEGEGFFVIQNPEYGPVLTRNGEFEIDGNGYLTLSSVGQVLDKNSQPIQLQGSDFKVDNQGNIFENSKQIGSLYIAHVEDKNQLIQVGTGFFRSDAGFTQENIKDYLVFQGAVEDSNVNITKELSQVIARQNNYSSCSEMIKIFDRISEMASNQIGKLG